MKYPVVNASDVAFWCTTREGPHFYCKADKDGRAIRASEMLLTRIASHIGILTPDCSIVDDDEGETYFGSRSLVSPADDFELRRALSTVPKNEVGGRDPWLGSYLAGIYALDLAFANPDRCFRNFLMDRQDRRIRAFDFASVNLKNVTCDRFVIEGTNTLSVGRQLRAIHGFDLDAALEMVGRLEAIPMKVLRSMVRELPEDWFSSVEGEVFCEKWEHGMGPRLSALSAGLRSGSLL